MQTYIHRLFAVTAIVLCSAAMLVAQELEKSCKVAVSFSRRGNDAVTTVTVTNTTKKRCIDPVVRVRFYDKDGKEVATDAKAYFATIPPKGTKRMEARIFSDIPPEATTAKGALDAALFE